MYVARVIQAQCIQLSCCESRFLRSLEYKARRGCTDECLQDAVTEHCHQPSIIYMRRTNFACSFQSGLVAHENPWNSFGVASRWRSVPMTVPRVAWLASVQLAGGFWRFAAS